jgi:hypothetical protein
MNRAVVLTRLCALLALAAGGVASASAQTVIYVNGSLGTGANTGASWVDAFRGSDALQRALDAAAPIAGSGQTAQLWVAAGTYVPTGRAIAAEPLSVTFSLQSGEEVYGGFAGDEATLEERDPVANPTVLSGDIPGAPPPTGRAWHVVTASDVNRTCILDGFTVTRGSALSQTPGHQGGGAIFGPGGSPVVRRCRMTDNNAEFYGGAGYFPAGAARFESCTIDHNLSWGMGGGLYTDGFVTLLGCTLSFNHCGGANDGGAVRGGVLAEDTSFTSNRADGGGAISGNSSLVNCTFEDNYADQAPACIEAEWIDATGCAFRNNSVYPLIGYMAVFYVYGPGPGLFTDCEFTGNDGGGPAIGEGGTFRSCRFVDNSGDYIAVDSATNCYFSGNTAIRDGTLVNCTIVNGGGIYLRYGGTTTVTNCILWGNNNSPTQLGQINPNTGTVVLNYSDVQGLTGSLGGVGNFSADPHLDAAGRLLSPSPCVDSGDSGAVPPGTTTDGFGQPRFADDPGMPNTGASGGLPPVDVGAFEFQGATCYGNCDGSTAPPVLSAADFTCFLNAYAIGSPYANCDASTVPPRLNVADFGCFLRAFSGGCP